MRVPSAAAAVTAAPTCCRQRRTIRMRGRVGQERRRPGRPFVGVSFRTGSSVDGITGADDGAWVTAASGGRPRTTSLLLIARVGPLAPSSVKTCGRPERVRAPRAPLTPVMPHRVG